MVTFSVPGLFGKLPDRADFVRVRAAEPAARALVLWLEEGSEAAKRSGVPMGPDPVRFLLSPPGGARALVGVLGASADQVGRRFPLAVWSAVEGRDLAAGSPLVPLAARGFLDAAAGLLVEAGQLTAADLPARLDALAVPAQEALDRGQAELAALARSSPAEGWLRRLFGDPAAGQHWYGLHCFRVACQPLRGREPAGPGVVLDCPAQVDLDRFAWLDLARRALAWSRPPTSFWSEAGSGRLLLALGAPPAGAFAALWSAAHRDGKLWPLTTAKPEAVAAGKKALGPAVVQLLERPGASVADLLATLQPERA